MENISIQRDFDYNLCVSVKKKNNWVNIVTINGLSDSNKSDLELANHIVKFLSENKHLYGLE